MDDQPCHGNLGAVNSARGNPTAGARRWLSTGSRNGEGCRGEGRVVRNWSTAVTDLCKLVLPPPYGATGGGAFVTDRREESKAKGAEGRKELGSECVIFAKRCLAERVDD